MSSAKRPYIETISTSSLNDDDDYLVVEDKEKYQVVERERDDMDIEQITNPVNNQEENFLNIRRRKLNSDKDDDDLLKSPFPSNLNNDSSSSSRSTSSPFNYSLRSTTSNTSPYPITSTSRITSRFHKVSTTSSNVTSHPLSDNSEVKYITPRDYSLDNNNNNDDKTSSKETKMLTPIDLLMTSPPISTSTPKTNQTKNTSNPSITLTTNDQEYLGVWNDSRDTASNTNTSNDSPTETLNSSNNDTHFNHFSQKCIRTELLKSNSKGPFSSIYSQIYDNDRVVIDVESFNYLIQLYEFCDNSSTKLTSIITSMLPALIVLLNNRLDGFDIPFIEHHKWNGSSFYGSIDIVTLLDQLDDGLGISSTGYVYYNGSSFIKTGSTALQSGSRQTFRSREPTSTYSTSSLFGGQNLFVNNSLRYSVLDREAERDAERFLVSLAEEEEELELENNDAEQVGLENNNTEHEEESDSFTEISKDDYETDDDDDSLINGFASTSIRQPIDTFGNPISTTKTTSAVVCRISRPSTDDNDNETDDDSDNLTENTFEEVDDFSDIDSVATDSTIEDGWHSVSRNN